MSDALGSQDPIPFELFAGLTRTNEGQPIIALRPPLWAAATHGIVVDDVVHYYWCRHDVDVRWSLMHATAPADDLTHITQDAHNPIVTPSHEGFDDMAVEYPFPFRNPCDGRYYMYYRGKGRGTPEQTGLLVCEGDMGVWTRVQATPVIPAEADYEREGSTHPSVAVVGETLHIIYTGKATRSYEDGLTLCHATAATRTPAAVRKDPANPVFSGSGQDWDCRAVRETELFKGPHYFHILYGGYDGAVWRIGHVRTRDFRTFEPNPYNPIFSPVPDPDAWDSDGVLTGQVLQIGGTFYMLYAGKHGEEWPTGLAVARR